MAILLAVGHFLDALVRRKEVSRTAAQMALAGALTHYFLDLLFDCLGWRVPMQLSMSVRLRMVCRRLCKLEYVLRRLVGRVQLYKMRDYERLLAFFFFLTRRGRSLTTTRGCGDGDLITGEF